MSKKRTVRRRRMGPLERQVHEVARILQPLDPQARQRVLDLAARQAACWDDVLAEQKEMFDKGDGDQEGVGEDGGDVQTV